MCMCVYDVLMTWKHKFYEYKLCNDEKMVLFYTANQAMTSQ